MCFSWDLYASDPEWAVLLVFDALASLPLLQDLHLRCWFSPKPSWQLRQLPHIVNFSFTCACGMDNDCSIIIPVARFIGWSQPKLKTLMITDHRSARPNFNDFLSETPDSVFLNITHLSLSGLFVGPDTLIPHFRSLISVHIKNIFSPQDDQASGNPGPSSGNVWSSLRLEHKHLQEIVTDDVQLALIEYLTSFSGLRSFRLTQASRYTMTPLESDQLAIEFYGRALQNHVHSLESLEINANYGDWSFASHCSSIIKQCACLTSLKLSINSKDIEGEKDHDDDDDDEDGDGSKDGSDNDEQDSSPGRGKDAVVCFQFMTSHALLNIFYSGYFWTSAQIYLF